jgi:hypothetical protein
MNGQHPFTHLLHFLLQVGEVPVMHFIKLQADP